MIAEGEPGWELRRDQVGSTPAATIVQWSRDRDSGSEHEFSTHSLNLKKTLVASSLRS